MQVDEGAGQKAGASQLIDLTLTKRLFSQLHPEALSIPNPIIPSTGDFEREYALVLAEQEHVIKGILLVNLLSNDCSKALSQALVSVLRGLTPRATPLIAESVIPAEAQDFVKEAFATLKEL